MEDLESRPKLAIMKEAAVAVRNQVIDMESHSKKCRTWWAGDVSSPPMVVHGNVYRLNLFIKSDCDLWH